MEMSISLQGWEVYYCITYFAYTHWHGGIGLGAFVGLQYSYTYSSRVYNTYLHIGLRHYKHVWKSHTHSIVSLSTLDP